MVFWLVKLESESSWISVCPSPKYQLFIEVFIGKSPVFSKVNASQLAARRGSRARSVCLAGVWEPSKARQAAFLLLELGDRCDELWWAGVLSKSFSSPWLLASALPFPPILDVYPALDILWWQLSWAWMLRSKSLLCVCSCWLRNAQKCLEWD